jgi:DNA-binding MarR family transcriptional regulator
MADDIDHFRRDWARELPDLDTEPMALLGRIHRIAAFVRPGIEATFGDFNLERGEFDVIAALRRAGSPYSLTPTQLYGALLASSGGLTYRLNRLEEAGLITRAPSPTDARSRVVTLTQKGQQIAEAAFRTDMSREMDLLNKMPKENRDKLAALLRELLMTLESSNKVPDSSGRIDETPRPGA